MQHPLIDQGGHCAVDGGHVGWLRAIGLDLREYGTGGYRKDLPLALSKVERVYAAEGSVSHLHALVLRAAARRIDEIAREIQPWGDKGTIQIAMDLRALADEAQVAS